ncbi:hypothetical protein DPMN_175877 [Dreissena polymorpha]|uniref:Uncharacterized protein n=1 Tax=Dreissena polymorpha TaxID=45954 RepID=A0A9D4E9V7_DREPO|nr:hypothetical protein DPMN_175877 [Dreissena polymorpha]
MTDTYNDRQTDRPRTIYPPLRSFDPGGKTKITIGIINVESRIIRPRYFAKSIRGCKDEKQSSIPYQTLRDRISGRVDPNKFLKETIFTNDKELGLQAVEEYLREKTEAPTPITCRCQQKILANTKPKPGRKLITSDAYIEEVEMYDAKKNATAVTSQSQMICKSPRPSTSGIQKLHANIINILTKFHKDWMKTVTSIVYTRFF